MATSQKRPVYLVSACRTPIGAFQGGLAPKSATELGAMVIREAVKRAGVSPESIDEVIMGNVIQAGNGQAPARQAAIHSGLPPTIPAMTVNKVCGSGLKAVMLAAQSIRAGDNECVVAGGMESMSNTPYLLHGAKQGLRFGHKKFEDAMILDGLWDPFENWHMGNAAEYTADKGGVSRERQDEFSLWGFRFWHPTLRRSGILSSPRIPELPRAYRSLLRSTRIARCLLSFQFLVSIP